MTPSGGGDRIVGRRAVAESPVTSWIKTLSACTLMSLLGLAAVMLVWRRLAGALHEPLELPALAITACALAAAGLSIRLLLADGFAARASGRSWRDRLIPLAPMAAILLTPMAAILAVGFSLSVPGTSAAGLAVLWSLIAVEEIYSLVLSISFRSPTTVAAGPTAVLPAKPAAPVGPEREEKSRSATQPSAADLGAGLDIVPFDDTADEQVTQQLVRTKDRGGGESMSGLLRAHFSAGQRNATVHIAFCPPFSAVPTMKVEQVDGPPGRIKTVQLLPYGARFDLKLSKDAEEPLAVSLRFSARA